MALCLCGCGQPVISGRRYVQSHHLKCKSSATLAKISQSKKGKNCGKSNPNYGNKWTEEQKLKSRNKMMGRYIGENNPFFGKHHTEEAKTKNALAHIGKMTGEANPSKREAVRQVISNSKKGERNPMYGKYREQSPRWGLRGKLCPSYGVIPPSAKRIYHVSPLQGTVCFRSSWEFAYAKYLDSINELWYYEIETFELTGGVTYTPDFFLPRLNKFVEIKGRFFGNAETKIDKFKTEYFYDLDILTKTELNNMGILVR